MPTQRVIAVTFDPNRGGHRQRALWLGIRQCAEEHDWRLAIDYYADTTPAESYDGVLTHTGRDTKRGLPSVPTVRVMPARRSNPTPVVTGDCRLAGRLAALHLLECGYPSLALFGRNRERSSSLQMEGFRATARRKGGHAESVVFSHGLAPTPTMWPRFCAILGEWCGKVEPPVGVLATDDLLARRLIDACARAGLRIPEDVGIVGCGNDPLLCEVLTPTLTSVDLDDETVGALAAATLDGLLGGELHGPIHDLVPPLGIVRRRSTDLRGLDDSIVSAALGWIARHCHEPIRVGDVADGIGVPARKLREFMRGARHHSVVHAIAQARLARALSLLESTDHHIETVAQKAGYTSGHVMTAALRKHLHTTPHAYRQAVAAGDLPPFSPIVQAMRLLRETPHSVQHIALVTGYQTDGRLNTALRRHTGASPGVWRSVHGGRAVRTFTIDPNPPWPQWDGKEME